MQARFAIAETQVTVTAEVKVYGPISVTVFGDIYRASNSHYEQVELRHDRASILQAVQAAGGFQVFGGRVTLIPAKNPGQPVLYDSRQPSGPGTSREARNSPASGSPHRGQSGQTSPSTYTGSCSVLAPSRYLVVPPCRSFRPSVPQAARCWLSSLEKLRSCDAKQRGTLFGLS